MLGRKLVYEENFAREKQIDPKMWHFDDGPSYNAEIEKYTSAGGGNAYLTRDGLVIEARKNDGKVTSARLTSNQSWKYGYFEFVAKVPTGRGTWPALWMLGDSLRHPNSPGWPACGEIDIMENVGYDPDNFHYSLHCKKYNFMVGNERTKVVPAPDAPASFHTFGLDWRDGSITFYQDHKAVYHVDRTENTVDAWPWDAPFYMILNLAIGGNWGGAKGVDDAIFPSKFIVKSVKIYQ
jgi:beta-glucanase (GH16 family)